MTWIFQGNPNRYNIDEYLLKYPSFIYWRTRQYADQIRIGDRAFIWRSGRINPGIIAIGTVYELPTAAKYVKVPSALGSDLWIDEAPDPDEIKTGISIEEVRLSPPEKMALRDIVKRDQTLSLSTIITAPYRTVFKITEEQTSILDHLWYG